MWLFTQHGFYSIVQVQGNASQWQVRARVKQDLVNLVHFVGLKHQIIASPDADYAFRIIVNRDERIAIFDALQGNIDYSNFKDRIHDLPDQANKNQPYMQIWGILRNALQPVLPKLQRATSRLWEYTREAADREEQDYLNSR